MSIDLPFAEYVFTFKAQQQLTMPEYSGILWHSVLGKALYDISCVVPKSDCQHCLLASQCDYPVLFKGVKQPNSERMRRYQTIPAPHVLRPAIQQRYIVGVHETFQVTVLLFGNNTQKLPRLVHAMQKVASNGFGESRKKAQLIQVTQSNPYGLDNDLPLQMDSHYSSQAISYLLPNNVPNQVRLLFLSPFRPTGEAIHSSTFLMDKFIMAVIRRVSLLQYFYTGKAIEDDFYALKEHSKQVSVLAHTLQWQPHKALAKRRKQHKKGYAWSGSIDIDLHNHQALWPYLYLGQWLHVGKNASMGLGCYQLTCLLE